ncbi:C40 family peptidase [Hymenobacter sp. GOD-10R]|uniref:C40 family peptidase n=1 Tax=Hymenobacter sp. GOD-10R TaxID=3093922 RepID=UPI002D78ED9C|nr:C40 family peptidase [Hymenobacter sp. GOD-10R]WRQ26408.1 C40 family peptidase [Hymenobacter sp. GOD-10R]
MRYVWISFIGLALLLLGLIGWQHRQAARAPLAAQSAPPLPVQATAFVVPRPTQQADSIVAFALKQLGSPYTYAGVSPRSGFDCSGFVMYVYGHFAIDMPHSTAQLIDVGREVPRLQARKGDIVVFTGTAATSTTPGHAGIVISDPGEPIRFVHASSARRESGVKISEVAGTDYERRFMSVRRVLAGERTATPKPSYFVKELEPVAVAPATAALAPALATVKKVSVRSTTRKRVYKKADPKKPVTKRTTVSSRRRTSSAKSVHHKASSAKK